jgi:hypothetical protein
VAVQELLVKELMAGQVLILIFHLLVAAVAVLMPLAEMLQVIPLETVVLAWQTA